MLAVGIAEVEQIKGIVIIVGNYGSGKTEVSINLAVNQKRAGVDVKIADLDLVNPYFRTREARNPLLKLGIEVVVPEEKYLQADLPILSPAVSGLIRHPMELTLIDAGGNDVAEHLLSHENRLVEKIHLGKTTLKFTNSFGRGMPALLQSLNLIVLPRQATAFNRKKCDWFCF